MLKHLIPILFLSVAACVPREEKAAVTELKATLFYKIPAKLGEGPIWNHQTNELYWVDIIGQRLYLLNTGTKAMRHLSTPTMVGTVVPMDDSTAVIALMDGAYKMNLKTGSIKLFQAVQADNPATRLNDGKCDPAGRFWVGSMHMPQTEAAGGLYQVTEDTVLQRLDNITISNGIVWTADKETMYYIDTPTGVIRAFDYEEGTGSISNERMVVQIADTLGSADGMAIDAEDKLWVGLWNGNSVVRFDPETGDLLARVEVPAHNVTACAFGGQNLDSLFITTSSLDMTAEEQTKYPDAGSIFVVVPGVKGVRSTFYQPEID